MPDVPKTPRKPVPPHHAVGKAEGDGPVLAWIALLPTWQSARAGQIDAIITATLPQVRKAVKWHGAWYGQAGQGWFLALNTFKAHLKLTFFQGCNLVPPPPVAMAQKPASALDLQEKSVLDAARIAEWVAQAARLPGLFKA